MHVYIDDSGDGGMKLGAGSSSHLVMAAMVFRDVDELAVLDARVAACRAATGHTREFKFSRTRDSTKDAFFAAIQPVEFVVRAIIVDKARIHSAKLRASPGAMKSYAIRQLLSKNFGQIVDAKVFVDGQETRGMDLPDTQYLPRMVNRESPGTISKVRFVDSTTSTGIQLADMVAGAIHRAFRADRPDNQYWLTVVRRSYQPQGTLWHFCNGR